MKYEPFDCCSAYNECSDLGRCIRAAEKRNVCTYWIRHLSKGIAFYGKNPGILEGYIFINIDNRSFRISKRKKDISYIMDRNHRNELMEEFNFWGIPYSTKADGECIVTGCPENPAKFKIDFAINEFEYTIKNYNGWALEADIVQQVIEEIGDRIKLIPNPPLSRRSHDPNIDYHGYYGRETTIVFDQGEKENYPKQIAHKLPIVPRDTAAKEQMPLVATNKHMEEKLKLPTDDEMKQGKLVQVSIWDVIWSRV